MAKSNRGWMEPRLVLEIFVILNLGFLTFDSYLAHSTNQFRKLAEYIPLFFSACAPFVLAAALFFRRRWFAAWKIAGYLVGISAVVIGIAGAILHLDSAFFYERTIKSLTYSAPFAAPLAYTGLGFLVLLNRMVNSGKKEWAQWVLFFTLGGFIGNFIFSLVDHAENGFFNRVEWVPVVASAFAVGFLITPLLVNVSRKFLLVCGALLGIEIVVGTWGFVLHCLNNLHGPSIHAFDNFIYGAPPFAPLLFPNLSILGLIALWRLLAPQPSDSAA
jgi:hypothetical protein